MKSIFIAVALLAIASLITAIPLTVTNAQVENCICTGDIGGNVTEIVPTEEVPAPEVPLENVTAIPVNETTTIPITNDTIIIIDDGVASVVNGSEFEPVLEETPVIVEEPATEVPTEEEEEEENGDSGFATDLQIQLVPEVQRGHNQHVTIFAVDPNGNAVFGEEIDATVTNQRGVDLREFTVESGEDESYKVGPNTSPQNITITAETESGLENTQTYEVFPKE